MMTMTEKQREYHRADLCEAYRQIGAGEVPSKTVLWALLAEAADAIDELAGNDPLHGSAAALMDALMRALGEV